MKRKISVLICTLIAVTLAAGSFAGCSRKNKISNETTAFVVMSEEMDGVFNPFFATSGPDTEVLGMTQVGMLSANDSGELAYGENEPTVVLDYNQEFTEGNAQNKLGRLENGKYTGQTTYTFVLKNGIKFSDGTPLSYRDVLFNMYVYLDPVYTGSSTMYSTDIVGMQEYRTQSNNATEEAQEETATNRARTRLTSLSQNVKSMIDRHNRPGTPDYKVYTYTADKNSDELRKDLIVQYGDVTNDKNNTVVKDYDRIKELFEKEVNDDYKGAVEAYKDEPYFMTDIQGFLYSEGFIEWDKKEKKMKNADEYAHLKTREEAIDYVIRANFPNKFTDITSIWGTAGEILSEFIAEARENALTSATRYRNISGITVLDGKSVPSVQSINGKTYSVASAEDFNADWSVKTADKYQVLQIKINGKDPKAIWNFAFSVAPMHYYSSPELVAAFNGIDNFGVKYASLDFMNNTIKGGNKVGVPLGAGPYKATDRNHSSNPEPGDFKNGNIVYFVRNENFMLGSPKIKYVNYQVVNQSQSVNTVRRGDVHYSIPQATTTNMNTISSDGGKNLEYVTNQQLGYGYIGINAGKIPDIALRRAIIYACDTSLCMQYYTTTAKKLAWPMSKASWAYPRIGDDFDDDYRYPSFSGREKEAQDEIIQLLGTKVKNSSGGNLTTTGETVKIGDTTLDQYQDAYYSGKRLKFTFTIAGANLTEHPTYNTFKKAADILNACGWDVDVRADNYTLTKLATGALDVWAAAWSTTVDPDMYQVYHRNSKATSVLNWGYRELKSGQSSNGYGPGTLKDDYDKIVKPLSDKIDEARKVLEKEERIPIYRDCLEYVMELAVEFPTYQRDNIYLYNKNIVDGSTLHKSESAFANPLSRIWEVSLKESK